MDVEGAVGQPDGGSEGDGEGAAAQQPGGVRVVDPGAVVCTREQTRVI